MNPPKTKSSDKSSAELCCMAFTPQSSPTRGGEVIFITYSDDFPLPDHGEFYVVFDGKKQRHVTTAQQLNTYTVRAVVPDHNQAERVSLTIYFTKENKLETLSSHKFLYLLETDQIIAQLLADNASDGQLFESLASLSTVSNNVSKDLKDSLDSRITNAFEFLDLSPAWTLFGEDGTKDIQQKNGQETLLHLSARLGFTQLATYLLDQPGSEEALNMHDKLGKSPEDIAREKGMKLLADMLSKGPGQCEQRSPKDLSKPQVKKSEIGTTSISRYKTEEQIPLEKDIEILQQMNSLVEEEMKKRIPKFRHSWPVKRKVKETADASSSDEELKQINRDHMSKKHPGQLNSVVAGRTGGGANRHLLEQNLRKLRDINEEIQKLRVSNVQRGSREAIRAGLHGRHVRRLSCPALMGPDLLQAQMTTGIKAVKDEKPTINGTVDTNKDISSMANKIRTLQSKESTPDSLETTTSNSLSVNKNDVVKRSRSWRREGEERPAIQRKVSGSLDDLTKQLDNQSKSDEIKARGRTAAASGRRPASLLIESPKEEGSNKLADILDSIKKASEAKNGNPPKSPGGSSVTSLTDVDLDVARKDNGLLSPNKSNLHTKSYSYSCLADLKFGEDGEPLDDKNPGSQSPDVQKRGLTKNDTTMSLMDFLNDQESQDKAQNRLSLEEFLENPDDSADDSEELEKGIKPHEGRGLRRLSMLFGSKSSKPSKRELPRLQKTGGIRSSLRKDKGLPISNSRNKDDESKKDSVDSKENKEPAKMALGRRVSGVSTKTSKPKEQVPVLPNPSLLTRAGKGGTVPSRSHLHTKPSSPLPFRNRSFTATEDDSKDKEKDKDKTNAGVSAEEGSGDDDDDDEAELGLELQGDPDLEIKDEPEAWSVTVDKKVLKRMTAKDIKRQDVIHELIQTEAHHVRTLKIMQKIFHHGMLSHVGMPKETVDQILPRLDDLLQINGDFLNRLKASEGEDTVVVNIGDVLQQQFSGENSDRMKSAYGEFCSYHMEAVDLYKKLLRTDKKFADFIKKCNMNKLCRRLSIPECITLVTQRLTKYPILIEAIVKTTRESKADYMSLTNSITLVKGILQSVDMTIKDHEREKTLADMKVKLDLKVTVTYKGGNKVKNIDFASNTSKLLHDGVLLWKSARAKLTETRVLVLEDMLVFLQEKDQKYSLLSLDQKAPVVRLSTLMVREVATDVRAIYLVSTSREGPEMYEMVCDSPKDKKQWMDCIRDAITNAPKDENQGDGLITTRAGERLKIIIRRANVLIDQNMDKDMDKGKHVAEMQELISQIESMEKSKLDSDKAKELSKAKEALVTAVQHVQSAVSSEEHSSEEAQSDTQGSASLGVPGGIGPKRAETFSGFDSKLKPDNKDVNRASSMRTERPFPSRQLPGAVSPVVGGSPKIKHKRRASGGGWSFLKSGSKEEKEQGEGASDSPSSSPSHTPTPSPSPGQEPEAGTDSDSGVKSARFRPVRDRSDGSRSPTQQTRADPYRSRLKQNLREQVQHLSSRSQRQTNAPSKDEEDKEPESKNKTPGTTQEVIYF